MPSTALTAYFLLLIIIKHPDKINNYKRAEHENVDIFSENIGIFLSRLRELL